MASFSFPPNPTLNQTYSSNGRTFKWNGVTWAATMVSTPTSSPVYVSVSPPPNPISGTLWYDSNNSNLNIYYVDLNGGQWVSVVPYPQDSITQQGGVFEGPIYAKYEIPNSPAAFITAGYFKDQLVTYLTQNGYTRSGNGIQIDSSGQILAIDSGLIV